jgi:hypothetical protein
MQSKGKSNRRAPRIGRCCTSRVISSSVAKGVRSSRRLKRIAFGSGPSRLSLFQSSLPSLAALSSCSAPSSPLQPRQSASPGRSCLARVCSCPQQPCMHWLWRTSRDLPAAAANPSAARALCPAGAGCEYVRLSSPSYGLCKPTVSRIVSRAIPTSQSGMTTMMMVVRCSMYSDAGLKRSGTCCGVGGLHQLQVAARLWIP